MRKTTKIALSFYLFTSFFFSVHALALTDFAGAMHESYEKNDQQVWIGCSYFRPSSEKLVIALGKTVRGPRSVERRFKLQDGDDEVEMLIRILKKGDDALYRAEFALGRSVEGEISSVKERSFYLPFTRDYDFNQKFEVNKVFCSLNISKEKPYVLNESKYHFAVHPHTRYDYLNVTSEGVISYLRNSTYQSLLLLEEGNFRGNLVELSDVFAQRRFELPRNFYESAIEEVFEGNDLVVSPAGHNDFSFQAQGDVEVLYTGGNHNYCIWNNTRNLLKSYFNSKAQGELAIVYDSSAIVAQRKGIIWGLSFSWFSHRKSNLLKDLFADHKAARKYHENYFEYFEENIDELYSGLYAELVLSYESQAFSKIIKLKGAGKRKLRVNFLYK